MEDNNIPPGKTPCYEIRLNIRFQTILCVICYSRARRWTGHVLRGNEHVIAGWCDNHDPMDYIKSMGYVCDFKDNMGLSTLN